VALVGKTELRGRKTSKTAAEKAAEKAITDARAGQQAIGGLTVGTYLTEQWLPGKRKLRPSTRARYEQFVRLYLVPYLGELPLVALQGHHIDTMFRRIEETNDTRRNPVGPATLADIRDCLRAALNHALRQRMVQYNAAVGIEVPEHDAPEVEPWEAEEVGTFLDEASTERLAVMWELIALHGLRRGEACGARWTDLDDLAGVLHVRQQITDSGGQPGVWPPKTRSGKGKVDIDAATLGGLLAHRLQQDSEREELGDVWDNGVLPDQHGNPVQLRDLMFTRPGGLYLDPQWVTRRMGLIARRAGLLATIRKDAKAGARTVYVGKLYAEPAGAWTLYVDRESTGQVTVTGIDRRSGSAAWLTLAEPLPGDVAAGAELGRGLLSRRRLHDLRHASASIQLDEGVDLALVSKRLRHSSPAITSKLYVHLLRSTGQRAAETVARAVPRRTPRAHRVPIKPGPDAKRAAPGGGLPGQRPVRDHPKRMTNAEDAGFEPGGEPTGDDRP
jgi:integrase